MCISLKLRLWRYLFKIRVYQICIYIYTIGYISVFEFCVRSLSLAHFFWFALTCRGHQHQLFVYRTFRLLVSNVRFWNAYVIYMPLFVPMVFFSFSFLAHFILFFLSKCINLKFRQVCFSCCFIWQKIEGDACVYDSILVAIINIWRMGAMSFSCFNVACYHIDLHRLIYWN